jgi:hypothetical protein
MTAKSSNNFMILWMILACSRPAFSTPYLRRSAACAAYFVLDYLGSACGLRAQIRAWGRVSRTWQPPSLATTRVAIEIAFAGRASQSLR